MGIWDRFQGEGLWNDWFFNQSSRYSMASWRGAEAGTAAVQKTSASFGRDDLWISQHNLLYATQMVSCKMHFRAGGDIVRRCLTSLHPCHRRLGIILDGSMPKVAERFRIKLCWDSAGETG